MLLLVVVYSIVTYYYYYLVLCVYGHCHYRSVNETNSRELCRCELDSNIVHRSTIVAAVGAIILGRFWLRKKQAREVQQPPDHAVSMYILI